MRESDGTAEGWALAELLFTAGDLARMRFAVAPMWEVGPSLRLLRAGLPHAVHGPWAEQVRPRLTALGPAFGLLAELVPPTGYVPDFINPAPAGPAPTLAEEVAAIRATPAGQVRRDLDRLAAERGALGPRLRALHADPEAGLARLAEAVEAYWELALAPYWPDARAVLDAEIDQRGRFLARHGSGALFNSLAPQLSWSDGLIQLESRFEVALPARTVLLMPTLVSRRIHVILDTVDGCHRAPTLMYPIDRPVAVPRTPGPALAQLLGPTRADLLAALVDPATTAALAARHFLSAGTVSYHLGVLHRSGLVSRVRRGREVLYRRTPRGEELLATR